MHDTDPILPFIGILIAVICFLLGWFGRGLTIPRRKPSTNWKRPATP